ncbi:hypothetical protein QJS04_geneDACA004163 [Acorus gramineus]|uniref:START domain-containing protein n=1 Tax=Acorus gramineus TaxID=55184 RepID=A0AAV9BIT5_ACOGR|nr:hypothetical protein QJS04_geneDACA004163 [Acorus gramineus]
MKGETLLPSSIMAGIAGASEEFWRENPRGGWATALLLLLLLSWQILSSLARRRRDRRGSASIAALTVAPPPKSDFRIAQIISDDDLRDLIDDLEEKFSGNERWENVIDKRNNLMSYNAKCMRPKDGPLKYLSVTIFENCSTKLLRDFYMDNEYRKEWDKMVVEHDQLQVDANSGTEIGRTLKKFPLLTPREYILAWRVWEGPDGVFYCLIKGCDHNLHPPQKKYVRVGFFRSGWRIRKVPGRDACEIKMVHQEDAGMNVEMAKLAFAKGIWSYVCKMDNALRRYPLRRHHIQSTSATTALNFIQKVPPGLESDEETSTSGPSQSSQGIVTQQQGKLFNSSSKKWVANGLLLLGGIVCLSRGRSALATKIAMACILKKLAKHGSPSGQAESSQAVRARHT